MTPSRDPRPPTAVLALGNVLAGDDGVGPAALADLLRRHVLPADLAVLDGGVLGLHLLGLLQDVRRLLVLDAVDVGGPPGTLWRLRGDQVRSRLAHSVSAHHVGFVELLSAARLRGEEPEHLVIRGLQVGRTSPGPRVGLGLSDPVARAVPDLADAAAEELRSWGCAVTPRVPAGPVLPYPDGILGLTRPAPGTAEPGRGPAESGSVLTGPVLTGPCPSPRG
ncbi:MAG: hydrogenase maturation protease [Actinomycetota bacterium]|nr:hydrogenase maturation protease [Actinomycetota bacterium]